MGMEFICDMIISGFLYFVEIIKNDSILKIDLVGKKYRFAIIATHFVQKYISKYMIFKEKSTH